MTKLDELDRMIALHKRLNTSPFMHERRESISVYKDLQREAVIALPQLLAVARAARAYVDAQDGDLAMAALRSERFEALDDALAALDGAE